MGSLLNEVGSLVMKENVRLLNAFLASEGQPSGIPGAEGKSCLLPLLKEDQDRDHLGKPDSHKSMVSDEVQPLGAEGAGRCCCYATLHHL